MQNLNITNEIIPFLANSFFKSEKATFIDNNFLLIGLNCLKKHTNFQYSLLSCISGLDLLYSKQRFGLVYELVSLKFNTRIRVKTYVNEITGVNSITSIFKNADWWEREVWDLYGVYFRDHQDLRRILTDYGFEGFPMRKNYPLSGFIELRYDQNKKRIVVESLELAQDFRAFVFDNPWK